MSGLRELSSAIDANTKSGIAGLITTHVGPPSWGQRIFNSHVRVRKLDAVLPGHLELVEKWFTSQLSPDALDSLLASLRIVRDGVRPEATAGADAWIQASRY